MGMFVSVGVGCQIYSMSELKILEVWGILGPVPGFEWLLVV